MRLKILDQDGGSDTAAKTITVLGQPPVASFDIAPASPLTGEIVTFTSTSTDPDGLVTDVAWDTDNDGAFDDGTDVEAERSYTTASTRTVRLRVTDDDNQTVIDQQAVHRAGAARTCRPGRRSTPPRQP